TCGLLNPIQARYQNCATPGQRRLLYLIPPKKSSPFLNFFQKNKKYFSGGDITLQITYFLLAAAF
ncbi:MAG: hypothetical protein IKU17_10795, partial [Clostridia bacterium]|nr:hypothetical protein [Clostridia bacterium]